MTPLTVKILPAALVAFFSLSNPAVASSDTVGANARLAFSDKLTMYSQRIIGSACAMTSPSAPFESRGFLAVAGREINRILAALEKGDMALGIPSPEEDEHILALIDEANDIWKPIEALSRGLLANQPANYDLRGMADRTDAFTKAALRVVSAVSEQYTDVEALTFAESIQLQIAGRQRMLTQQLVLQACTMQFDDSAEVRAALTDSFFTYERSAKALRDGMPAMGLPATTDPALLAALDEVDKLWSELKWPLFALQTGATWDSATQKAMYLKLNALMHEMDLVVEAYTRMATTAGT